jgi:hypothetical protein
VDNINEVVNIYTCNKVIKWIASLDFIFLGLFWSKTVKKWIVSLDFFFLGLFWVNIEKKVHELYFSCYILILVGNINEFTSIPKATTGA